MSDSRNKAVQALAVNTGLGEPREIVPGGT
jgi:hypothetical protein